MKEEIAAIECDPSTLAGAVGTAALAAEGNEPHEEMFVRVNAGGVDTPASGTAASQTSFCTLHPSLFDTFRVFDEISALFPVAEILGWLEWLSPATTMRATFLAEPGSALAAELRLSTARQEVSLDCVDSPGLLEDVEIWLPDRFEGPHFLDESGKPVPTRIETTATELDQVIGAVSRCRGEESYPLALEDDELRFECSGETARVSGTIDADVEGPPFTARYGPGFARVVRAIEGKVTLQTGPDQPLAIVSSQPGVTYRYVVFGQ